MFVIFSDVDGTIYKYGPRSLELRTLEDVKIAQNLGVEFILITGNAHLSGVLTVAKTLNIRYLITSGGAVIFDFKNNEFIRALFLPTSTSDVVLKRAQHFKLGIITWNGHQIFYNDPNKIGIQEIIKQTIALTEPLLNIKSAPDYLIKIIIFGENKKITKLYREFESLGFNVFRTKQEAIEISPLGVSKGEAVTFMTQYLKTSFNLVMTVGDGRNDKSMLELPVFSYALANAPQEVKDVARYNTTSVEQNGLGMAIIDFLHRNKIE